VTADGDLFKGGFGGQGLYVSPHRDLVSALGGTVADSPLKLDIGGQRAGDGRKKLSLDSSTGSDIPDASWLAAVLPPKMPD
jgi:hypothetical protein